MFYGIMTPRLPYGLHGGSVIPCATVEIRDALLTQWATRRLDARLNLMIRSGDTTCFDYTRVSPTGGWNKGKPRAIGQETIYPQGYRCTL